MKMNRILAGFVAGLTMLAAAGTASAQLLFYDDFNQFPKGTVFTTETNYMPGVWSLPETEADIWTNTGPGSVTASNLLDKVRLFFNAPHGGSADGNAGYGAELYNGWGGSNLTVFVTNGVVDVQWLSWIQTTKSLTATGGLAVSIETTDLDIGASGVFKNNPLLLYADNGSVYAFTNNPNNGVGTLPIVNIGMWSSHAGQMMTNHLVLNYPQRIFSLSLNGAVLTNNMVISQYFTNILTEVDFSPVEFFKTSAGNKFALDDVQIVVSNAGKDVHSFIVAAKGQQFNQIDASTVSLTANGWDFSSEVQAATTASVWKAAVHFPIVGKTNLVQDTGDYSNYWEFKDQFDTQANLDTAYSNGVYRLSILGKNQGKQESSLDLSGNSYPNTPKIANYDAAQAIGASTNFTLLWYSSGGAGGGTGDWVMLELDDVSGNVVLSTPDFGNPNALNGTVTSLVITAGTLQASSTYTGQLVFARSVAVDTNNVTGAKGMTGYFMETAFALTTLTPGPSCVLTPALATNDVNTLHTVTATVTANSVPVVGVQVHFAVTGVNPITTNLVTDTGGQTSFGYISSSPGTDTIQANGAVSGLAFTGTAVEVWLSTPVAACKDVTAYVGVNCHASVSAAQVNNGSTGTGLSYMLTPPGPYSLGTTNVTLTVTDNGGGISTCSATITVLDNTPPTVTCPSDIVTNVPLGQTSAVVNYPSPTISDNCSVIISTDYTPASGSTFALGTNQVICTATDGSDNTNSCRFNIIVTEAPAQADLALTASSSVATTSLNNAFTYTLSVTNKGPQSATVAQLIDTLPSGVVYSNATSTVGSCTTNASGVVTCNFGTLTNGSVATVSIVVVPTNFPVSSVNNSVTVTNSLLDPVMANNSTNIYTPAAIYDLAVTAFKAPKKVALSATKTNVVGKLSVTIQNRATHAESISDLTMLGNLVTVTLLPVGPTNCVSPVAQLVTPRSFPIALASGKSLKLAYTVNFTCANDPLATKIANHDDYKYVVTVDHAALDGQPDSHTADDVCPHNALGVDPYNAKIKDKGCGLKIKGATGTFTNVVTDVIDSRMPE